MAAWRWWSAASPHLPRLEKSMPRVSHVDRVEANAVAPPVGPPLLAVAALGLVPTTGWTHPRLAPYVYVKPPADGVWDFDFLADPPQGVVLEVLRPVASDWLGPRPAWCKGVRIHATSNQIAAALGVEQPAADFGATEAFQAAVRPAAGRESFSQTLAAYDHSLQPSGMVHWLGLTPKTEMKKLRRRLVLTVEGPDRPRIEEHLRQPAPAAAMAEIANAIAAGGTGLQAALAAALAARLGDLGEAYSARIDDQSHWIYWDA